MTRTLGQESGLESDFQPLNRSGSDSDSCKGGIMSPLISILRLEAALAPTTSARNGILLRQITVSDLSRKLKTRNDAQKERRGDEK